MERGEEGEGRTGVGFDLRCTHLASKLELGGISDATSADQHLDSNNLTAIPAPAYIPLPEIDMMSQSGALIGSCNDRYALNSRGRASRTKEATRPALGNGAQRCLSCRRVSTVQTSMYVFVSVCLCVSGVCVCV